MYSRWPEMTGMITFTWKEPERRTNLELYGTTVPARTTLRRWAPSACSKAGRYTTTTSRPRGL
jgi:hypothetical protein